MVWKLWLSLLACVGAAMFLAAQLPSLAFSQGSSWAPAARIPDYGDDSAAPYLVADRTGTVHAFNSQLSRTAVAVVYRQWTLAYGWTAPIDILIPPSGGEANIQGAYLDDTDTLHVAFFAGTLANAGIYYSQAPAAIADRAP